MALNVSVNLEPFGRIDVCGYRGLAVTRLADLCGLADVAAATDALMPHLLRQLGVAPPQSAISTASQAVSSV
jgi:lipoyl(octanoyl) transferase